MTISRIVASSRSQSAQACTATVPTMVEMIVTTIWSTFFTVDHLIFFIRKSFLKGLTKTKGGSDQAGLMAVFWILSQHLPVGCLVRHGHAPAPSPLPLNDIAKLRYGERRFVVRSSQKWPEVARKTQI
jgi:hypothetical protein